ncbi:hypothetical protein AMK06_CH02703 [Rhizobium sp. N541]|nr:hypothetical protein AMK05_CH02675 [Rhizobium sp. N324]ANM17591.1 hypothetical protein AMK06_CH02703 [Rhizobium sp. N541]ANM23976.1 hypothetical protein AMK07_CH02700 [Rhizobium sp. N941]OYD04651.1 hypothetical protein AMK08_CH102695 [Rhizobium sp. N4311]
MRHGCIRHCCNDAKQGRHSKGKALKPGRPLSLPQCHCLEQTIRFRAASEPPKIATVAAMWKHIRMITPQKTDARESAAAGALQHQARTTIVPMGINSAISWNQPLRLMS